MAAWTSEELNKIGTEEELEIRSRQDDGTLRKPVIIWVVRHGNDLYVRSVKGKTGDWWRGTQEHHEGRVWAAGIEKDVTFVDETDPAINDQIDDVYRTKYHHYAEMIVISMVRPDARATTLKLVPRTIGLQ